MPKYSSERKAAVLKKLLPPHHQSVVSVSREQQISEATLYHWLKQARDQGIAAPGSVNAQAEPWSGQAKLSVVLETAALNAQQLSEYCRAKGLYPAQVARWKAACIAGADAQPAADQAMKSKLQQSDQKMTDLKKQIRRKDKALAESAALLVWQKKFQSLWEDEA